MDILTTITDCDVFNIVNPQLFTHELIIYEAQSGMSAPAGATTSMMHSDNSMHSLIISSTSSAVPAISDGQSDDADIGKFLERKVKIHSQTWSVGADFAATISPWALYLNNAAVLNKLANYNLLHADMEITILINGTSFHVGMLLASYSYMNTFNEVVTIGGDTQFVTRSQRPHCWINASTEKSGCICVPFFVPTPYLSLVDPTFDAASIGTLHIGSLEALQQINAGTDLISVTVFAQLKNVQLTAPTQGLVAISGPQDPDFDFILYESQAKKKSKDEYKEKDGIISSTASAIADYAGYFKNIPYIGKLATATQIGATAMGGIARLFGYSKPTNLSDVSLMRNMPVSSLALTEGADSSQKLTVTGKQEITLDPSTVGFDGTDELTILSFAQTESYLTKFSWPVTAVQDDYLFAIDVHPMIERRSAFVFGGAQIIPTALSFVSRPFAEWSGSIRFRFQVVASQFHKGRLGIIYDPHGPSGTDPYNVTFNTIIDLADVRDVTFEVKWQNDRPYLNCKNSLIDTFWTTTNPQTRTTDRSSANGVLYVQVLNDLVVPDAVTPATILVSVSAGDDFELVNPHGGAMQVFPYPPVAVAGPRDIWDLEYESQASADEVTPVEENSPEGENIQEITTNVQIHAPQKSLIYYGERIVSIRQLIKRYCLWRTIGNDPTTAAGERYVYAMKAFPTTGGYDPDAIDTTFVGSTPYWYCQNTYLTYFKYFFAGWRGSIRYKFLPLTDVQALRVEQTAGESLRKGASTFRPIYTSFLPTSTNPKEWAQIAGIGGFYSASGSAATQNRTMDSLEVEIPYQVPLRFSLTQKKFNADSTNSLENGTPGGSAFHIVAYTAPTPKFGMDAYVAAGEDFNFFGKVGAPVMYRHSGSGPFPG